MRMLAMQVLAHNKAVADIPDATTYPIKVRC